MDIITIILIALALAADAFAVSISNGICYKHNVRQDVLSSSVFGIFQGGMILLGYFASHAFIDVIKSVDHWIAFCLLGAIGAKMVIDTIRKHDEDIVCNLQLTPKLVFTQGVATSIDALIIGVSFIAIDVNIYYAALVIGIITFACCLVGHVLGKKLGNMFGNWAQIIGGVILIAIGVKVLISHLSV